MACNRIEDLENPLGERFGLEEEGTSMFLSPSTESDGDNSSISYPLSYSRDPPWYDVFGHSYVVANQTSLLCVLVERYPTLSKACQEDMYRVLPKHGGHGRWRFPK